MLSRRIWQKRAFISAQTFFSASTSRSSPALFVKPNAPSSPVTPNFARATRYWFSTQPALDLPATKIVDVPLAQTGEGIAECELLKWHVQEGDYVEDFQPLCEVQSDKATIEITSRYKGKVSNILYVPGDIVKVGETLLKILIDESAFPSTTLGDSENAKSPDSDQTLVNESVSVTVIDDSDNAKSVDSDPGKGRQTGVLSTPAVRSLAKQHGIDINEVCGTGKDGRVLIEDVLNFAVMKGITKNPSTVLHTDSGEQLQGAEGYNYAVTTESYRLSEDRTLPLRGFHRAMVKSMSLAAKVPHFHYVDEINCDALVELKTSFQKNNPSPDVKYTFLPILIKSLSMALVKYPFMNSCFKEDALEVILKGPHNIGIAMATQNGLVVPNIKNVQSLSIMEITKELARLQQLASNNKLTSEDICGGTITLSNIGAIGGKFGSPLINLPEVSIIAIGKIQKVPRFADNGNVVKSSGERLEMAYSNGRRTLAYSLARALCSSSRNAASPSRCRFAFALLPTKQSTLLPRFSVRTKSSGSGYSPLNDPSPNWSNRPPKETILLDGCDYEHWLIVMEFPDNPKPSDDHMVNTYVKTLAQVLGSEEEAKKKIYSVSTSTYTGFGALISEELSYKLKELPGVLWVLPDSYLDVPNKDYGGDLFVDGKVIPRPQYRYSERQPSRSRPRPRHDRRRETMQVERRDQQNWSQGQGGNMQPSTAMNSQNLASNREN